MLSIGDMPANVELGSAIIPTYDGDQPEPWPPCLHNSEMIEKQWYVRRPPGSFLAVARGSRAPRGDDKGGWGMDDRASLGTHLGPATVRL